MLMSICGVAEFILNDNATYHYIIRGAFYSDKNVKEGAVKFFIIPPV